MILVKLVKALRVPFQCDMLPLLPLFVPFSITLLFLKLLTVHGGYVDTNVFPICANVSFKYNSKLLRVSLQGALVIKIIMIMILNLIPYR